MLSTYNIICAQGIMDLWNKYQDDKYIEYAEQKFIEKASFFTERDALSHEIDYYKPPYIKTRQHVRDLTGKDIIHICNIIQTENREDPERILYTGTYVETIDNIKEYALDNPNKIIAHEFYFSGTFTTGDRKSKYTDRSMSFIVVPKLEDNINKYRFFYCYGHFSPTKASLSPY